MSRLCVKNIGQNATEKHLKEFFSSKGEVTDVKIVKTKSGKSRHFAFIGYRTEEQCRIAQQFFNNSYLNTSKLSVEIAKKVGDPTLAPTSSLSKRKLEKKLESAKEIVKKPKIEKREKKTIVELDRSKMEFFDVMKSRGKAKFWGNDDGSDGNQLAQESKFLGSSSDIIEDSNHVTSGSSSEESEDEMDIADVAKDNAISDMDYLKSKMKSSIVDSDDDEENSNDMDENDNEGIFKSKSTGPSRDKGNDKNVKNTTKSDKNSKNTTKSDNNGKNVDSNQDSLSDTINSDTNDVNDSKKQEDNEEDEMDDSRIFIRNLPFSCNEDELLNVFEPYGKVTQIHIPLNDDKCGKGYGFVEFLIPENAKKAISELDGSSFQGRLLHLIQAKKQLEHVLNENDANENGGSGSNKKSRLSSFQQKQEQERKKLANKRDGWNASHVRADTVIDALSEK